VKQSKERGRRKEREAPTCGVGSSAIQEKKKKEKERWAAAEEGEVGRWAAGLKGKVSFLFFLFQTLLKIKLFN
jgi:hypothetical protein